MKTKAYLTIASIMLVAFAAVFWVQSCRKSVGEVGALFINDIVKELNSADSPEKAEIALRHLIQKVGIGISKQNSQYQLYTLDEDQIKTIAQAQSGYINGDTAICIGQYYNIFSKFQDSLELWSGQQYQFTSTLNKSLRDLQENARIALINPDDPNNSMLLTIIADNGNIPTNVSLFDSTILISPVSAFCYCIWNAEQYGNYAILKSSNKVNISACKVACIALGSVCGATCSAATGFWGTAACIFACAIATELCIESCHDQGGGK